MGAGKRKMQTKNRYESQLFSGEAGRFWGLYVACSGGGLHVDGKNRCKECAMVGYIWNGSVLCPGGLYME